MNNSTTAAAAAAARCTVTNCHDVLAVDDAFSLLQELVLDPQINRVIYCLNFFDDSVSR